MNGNKSWKGKKKFNLGKGKRNKSGEGKNLEKGRKKMKRDLPAGTSLLDINVKLKLDNIAT